MPSAICLFMLLSLSLYAAGDSFDYASGGSLAQHTATTTGSIAAGNSWSVTDELTSIDDETTGVDKQGQLGKVDIASGTLVKTAVGFSFTGGDVKITMNGGTVLLDDTFKSGTIAQNNGITFLNATFMNGGATEIESKNGVFSSNTVTSATVIPEPSSLLLLGGGLFGLWSLARNKLLSNAWTHVPLDETTS